MYESRTITSRKHSILILKNTPMLGELSIGDKGQFSIQGEVIGEKIEFDEAEQISCISKSIKIAKIEKIKNEDIRST